MELESKQKAIQMLAAGTPQEEIASDLGVSQSSVSRFAKKNQELIQKEMERLIEVLPDLIDQTLRDIHTSNELSKAIADTAPEITRLKQEQLKLLELGIRAGRDEQIVRDSQEYKLLSNQVLQAEEAYFGKLPPIIRENEALSSKFMALSYKKQQDIMRSLGIIPTPIQSVFMQNIFQSGSKAIIAPSILSTLGDYLKTALEDKDVIDVTPVEK